MQGSLRKMQTQLAQPVQYKLPLGTQLLELNPLIGQQISLEFQGHIACIHCDRKIKKSFQQGYCYPCFKALAQCDLCIMKPEICHYAAGTCREPQWAEQFCHKDHIVYLANSSGVKVGITRATQMPTRWIDQGATQALPILKVSSRHLSGLIEVIIAQHVSDKTNWQRMLKGIAEPVDLIAKRDALLYQCQAEIMQLMQDFSSEQIEFLSTEILEIEYPVTTYLSKIKSFNFDKQALVTGILQGIKGQYLIFDTGVINIRKFSGYTINLLH